MGAGSLSYFANIARATYDDLDDFLNTLRFPFRQIVDIFYGKPQEHEIDLIMKMTRSSALLTRIFGAVPLILVICSAVYNLSTFQHSVEELIVILVSDIGLYSLTFLVMWRFGSKLPKTTTTRV
jgi:hypothetical protein